jgi:hypothetical protein
VRLLVLFALAGCGLLPEGDGAPGPSAGNAPWTDLGAARVCRGEQAFAPPDAPPGGLCVRDTFVAAACDDDRDCRSREICFCGRCTVGFCAVASDCEAPRFCNFAQHRCDLPCDAGCADDESCVGGVCRVRCLESIDCQFGEVCEGNTCISDDCGADTDCLAGERCDLQKIPQQVLEPSAVLVGETTFLYLDLAEPTTRDDRAIWRAVSTDGVHFTIDPATPVLVGRAPAAVLDGGTLTIYFEDTAGQGLLAASGGGDTFELPRTVLVNNEARAPAAIHVGGDAIVYYSVGSSIALATGPVGEPLVPAGLVLAPIDVEVGTNAPGAAFWTPITTLGSPHVTLAGPDDGRSLHLYFSAFGQESAPGVKFGMEEVIPPNFSIGFAAADPTAPGALAVWPYGPVADRVDVFLTHLDELSPAVVEPARGVFRMYFIEATHDATSTTVGRLGVLGSGGSFGVGN